MQETKTLNRKARRAAAKKAGKNGSDTKMAWMAAKNLKPGDKIVTKDGRIGTVKAVNAAPGLHTVHNFAVEDHHTYFVGDGPGVWVHNKYGAADHDSLARQLKAKQFGERYGLDAGSTPEESLKFTEAQLTSLLNAAESGKVSDFTDGHRRIIEDLAELRGYSVNQSDSFEFLSDTQRQTLGRIEYEYGGVEGLSARVAEFRSYSDYVEANPLISNSLNALYSDGGSHRGVSYFDFQNNVIDNFVTGESFSVNAGHQDFRNLLASVQDGSREIYQSLIGGLFQGANSVLANDISTIIDQAATLNTVGLVEAASGALGGVAALRKGAFLRRTSTGGKSLPPSLAQQKALTQFAAEERANLMNFDTFKGMLSRPERDAIGKHPWLAKVFFGTHLEMRVASRVDAAKLSSPGGIYDDLIHTGRGNKPNDFIGSNNTRFDLTTNNPRAILSHQNRSAVDAVVTYDSLPNSFGYDFRNFLNGQ